jgi:hypothetical protein
MRMAAGHRHHSRPRGAMHSLPGARRDVGRVREQPDGDYDLYVARSDGVMCPRSRATPQWAAIRVGADRHDGPLKQRGRSPRGGRSRADDHVRRSLPFGQAYGVTAVDAAPGPQCRSRPESVSRQAWRTSASPRFAGRCLCRGRPRPAFREPGSLCPRRRRLLARGTPCR